MRLPELNFLTSKYRKIENLLKPTKPVPLQIEQKTKKQEDNKIRW